MEDKGGLMNAREELEKVICEKCFERKECRVRIGGGECIYRKEFVQAILDAGFVRLADVEIDEERLAILLWQQKLNSVDIKYVDQSGKQFLIIDGEKCKIIARTIAFTKPIRVKEGKMSKIFKYSIPVYDFAKGSFELELPKGAAILTVQVQHDAPFFWALVNPDNDKERRYFRVIGTGHPILEEAVRHLTYVGTFQERDGTLVWHLFEYFENLVLGAKIKG